MINAIAVAVVMQIGILFVFAHHLDTIISKLNAVNRKLDKLKGRS